MVKLTTQSSKHIVDRELCLYLLGWAKSCSILDDRGGTARMRHPSGEPVMKETNDESSSAIGCDVWMKLGSSMNCEHLADRRKPACKSSGSKSWRTVRAGL